MMLRRFIFAILLGAFASAPGLAQLLVTGAGQPTNGAAATCSDSTATTWQSAVVTAGGTVSAGRYQIICTMIAGLKTDGTWSLFDRFWIFAGENSQQALVDLVANETPTLVGSMTFTANKGYQATSTGYMTSTYNFSTATNYVQNSAHLMGYINSTSGTSNSPAIGNSDTGVFSSDIYFQFTDSKEYTRINNTTQGGITVASSLGMTMGSRTASTTTTTYKAGSSIGSDTGASSSIPNMTLWIFRSNVSSPTSDTSNRFAAISVGGGVSSGQASTIYSRVLTALTSIGAQ